MRDDILSTVVEVEKEIAKKLEIEQRDAQEQLEKLRSECEKEVIREEKRLQYALDKALADAKTVSGEKAAKLIKDAKAGFEKLGKISDDVLKTIIKKHIVRMLP